MRLVQPWEYVLHEQLLAVLIEHSPLDLVLHFKEIYGLDKQDKPYRN